MYLYYIVITQGINIYNVSIVTIQLKQCLPPGIFIKKEVPESGIFFSALFFRNYSGIPCIECHCERGFARNDKYFNIHLSSNIFSFIFF